MSGSSVSENLHQIQEKIAGLNLSKDITLVGVTKFQSLEKIREAVQAGLKILAVNYAQEGKALREALKMTQIDWHFIGHVQSRKVKFLPTYSCVQSIDRFEIALALNARMVALNRRIDVMVEVNIGEEPQKSGVPVGELNTFLEKLLTLSNIQLVGLMTMPPVTPKIQDRKPYFQKMNRLFLEHSAQYSMKFLSMGTSEDYLLALQEGANMVRLGTALFGSRS